jgi:hypothetical protein
MERARDYELKAFFTYVVQVLERLDIPYYLPSETKSAGVPEKSIRVRNK